MRKLKILGLGRCIIGHLEKALNSDYSHEVTFDHHYLLNYESCLNSVFSDEDISTLSSLNCIPSIRDQLLCLENLINYDICAIEIFPPSILYIRDKLLLCFENYSSELEKVGFMPSHQKSKTYNEEYILILEKLISLISSKNSSLKIILVNGEITDKDKKIGSIRLSNLLEEVKKSKVLQKSKLQILDMNELISNLTLKKKSSFEIAFPHIYIQHSHTLEFISISRDTKHATPYIRKLFLKTFCNLISKFDFSTPIVKIDTPTLDYFDVSFEQRALNYLSLNSNSSKIIEVLNNSKKFSLYVTYTMKTKDKVSTKYIMMFIDSLALLELSQSELKYYFYHIRTLCAFELSENQGTVPFLLKIANKIVLLNKEKLENSLTFALLWIKNIYLVYINSEEELFIKEIFLFQKNLSHNSYLLSFNEIKNILKKTQSLTRKYQE